MYLWLHLYSVVYTYIYIYIYEYTIMWLTLPAHRAKRYGERNRRVTLLHVPWISSPSGCAVPRANREEVQEVMSEKGRQHAMSWGSSVALRYTMGMPGLRHMPPSIRYSVVAYATCSSCQEPPEVVFCCCDGVLKMLLQHCSDKAGLEHDARTQLQQLRELALLITRWSEGQVHCAHQRLRQVVSIARSCLQRVPRWPCTLLRNCSALAANQNNPRTKL
jgi:hypothetical protein